METLSRQQATTFMQLNATARGEYILPGDRSCKSRVFSGQIVGFGLTPLGPDGYEGEEDRVTTLRILRRSDGYQFDVSVASVEKIKVTLDES